MVKYFVFVTVTVVFLLLLHFFDFLAVVSFFFFCFCPVGLEKYILCLEWAFSWIVNMKSTLQMLCQEERATHQKFSS